MTAPNQPNDRHKLEAAISRWLDNDASEPIESDLTAEESRHLADFAILDALLLHVLSESSARPKKAPLHSDDAAPVDIPLFEVSPCLPQRSELLGGLFLSYAAAILLVGIGLWIGSRYSTSTPSENASQRATPLATQSADPRMQFVGRVTGMVACQWADAANSASLGQSVSIGRRYALKSGLMEITYDSGAKVVLQGPCSFEAESLRSGFLAVGRLTARVSYSEKAASIASTHAIVADSPPTSPQDKAVFAIRTPTSVVTDMGTEFGVDVEESGASRTYVYHGRVEVAPVHNVKGVQRRPVLLSANESVQITSDIATSEVTDEIKVTRELQPPIQFVRQMPKREPIRLFNTGIGLHEGDHDPHWQVVARSDDSHFRPQAAVVVPVSAEYFSPNDRARSQWISLIRGYLPDDVTYTLRTTFHLEHSLLNTAVLQGKFMADNQVAAIRLNGRKLAVPYHLASAPFRTFYRFIATDGFVAGTNTLEIDVFNGGAPPAISDRRSPMSCRVELEGYVVPDWK